MIWGYVGWPGTGKTYGVVDEARKRFLARRVQVFTNMQNLRFPMAAYFDGMEDIVNLENGLIVADEAGIFLSSRFWKDVPRSCLMALAQVRHNGLDMLWTAQHEARVDTVLRELTNVLIRCRKFFGMFIQEHRDPAEKKFLERKFRRLNPNTWKLYDTFENISESGGGGGQGAAGRPDFWNRPEGGQKSRTQRPRLFGFRWYDGRLYHTEEGMYAHEYLSWTGRFVDDGRSRVEQISDEVYRRRWLSLFGLTVQDVPFECNPRNPWLPGWSPSERSKDLAGLVQG